MKAARAALTILVATLVLAAAPWPARAQAPAAGTSATSPGANAADSAKIVFVDVIKVLARSAAGVAAREQLEREKASMQRELDARREEIEKLREEVEKKGPLMTADARREKKEQLERKRRDATRLAGDFQRELARKEQQALTRIQQELAGVIARFGKQRGYYMVVSRQAAGVLYSDPEADVTDEIIRAFDQEAAGKGTK